MAAVVVGALVVVRGALVERRGAELLVRVGRGDGFTDRVGVGDDDAVVVSASGVGDADAAGSVNASLLADTAGFLSSESNAEPIAPIPQQPSTRATAPSPMTPAVLVFFLPGRFGWGFW